MLSQDAGHRRQKPQHLEQSAIPFEKKTVGAKGPAGGLCDGSYMQSPKPGNIPRADVSHLLKTLRLKSVQKFAAC